MTNSAALLIRPARKVDGADLVGAAETMIATGSCTSMRAFLRRNGVADASLSVSPVAVGGGAVAGVETRLRSGDGAQMSVAVAPAALAILASIRFGGAPRGPAPRAAASPSEMRLAAALAHALAADMPGDWAADDAPAEFVAGCDFTIDQLPAPAPHIGVRVMLQATSPLACNDGDWDIRLGDLVREIRLPVRSVLARPLLSAGEIARLRVGDVIPIRAPDRVAMLCGTHRLAGGRLVERDGHAAIEIEAAGEPIE